MLFRSDAFEYMEIEDETMRMRMFAQSLGEDPKKWFTSLTPNSIHNLPELYQNFINKWEIQKNPIQILSEYNNLKHENGESVKGYCTRFNRVYNALPPHFKPPLGSALEKFPECFDLDMTYQLRDKDPLTLEEMQKVAIREEANLAEKRVRTRSERKVTYQDEVSTSSPSLDPRIDDLVRSMAKMWEKIVSGNFTLEVCWVTTSTEQGHAT